MIALDANVLLELLEKRRYYTAILELFEQYHEQDITLGVSALSVSNTFYLAERHKIFTGRVEMLLKHYKTFAVTDEDITWALGHYKGKDFEDAVQVAAALREKCSAFLTIDPSLAKKYAKFLRIELIA